MHLFLVVLYYVHYLQAKNMDAVIFASFHDKMWENLVVMWKIIIKLQARNTEIVHFCGNSMTSLKLNVN